MVVTGVTLVVLGAVGILLAVLVSMWCYLARTQLKHLLGKLVASLTRRLRADETQVSPTPPSSESDDRRDDLMAWIVGLIGVLIGSACILCNLRIFHRNFFVIYNYDSPTARLLATSLALSVAMIAFGMKGFRALGLRRRRLLVADALLVLALVAVAAYQSALTFDRVQAAKAMQGPAVASVESVPSPGGRLRIAGAYDAPAAPVPATLSAGSVRQIGVSDCVEAGLPALVIAAEWIAWLFGATCVSMTCRSIVTLPQRVGRRASRAVLLLLPDDAEACAAHAVDAAAALGARFVALLRLSDPAHRLRQRIERTRLETELADEATRLCNLRHPHEMAELEHRLERNAREHQGRLGREKATQEQLRDIRQENASLERQLAEQRAASELDLGRERLKFDEERAELNRRHRELESQLSEKERELVRRDQEAQARFDRDSAQAQREATLVGHLSEMMLQSLAGFPDEMKQAMEAQFVARIRRELAAADSFADLLVRIIAVYAGFRDMVRQMTGEVRTFPPAPPTGFTGGV